MSEHGGKLGVIRLQQLELLRSLLLQAKEACGDIRLFGILIVFLNTFLDSYRPLLSSYLHDCVFEQTLTTACFIQIYKGFLSELVSS